MTTDERPCPDGCGERPLDGQLHAGATTQERERHRVRASRARLAQEKARGAQLAQMQLVLPGTGTDTGTGIDLDARGEVLAEGLCRDAEAVMAMATVVASKLRGSRVDAVTEMRAEQAQVVQRLTGEREEARGRLCEAERRRVALSAQLVAVQDELATARVDARTRLGCEEQLREELIAAVDRGFRLAVELERVQAEAAGLASEVAAVTATRDASVAEREDLVRRLEQAVDRERHARQDAVALRTELGPVASTIASELAAAATVATAERAAAVREAHAEHRREIADLHAQVTRLTPGHTRGLAPGLIVVRR
jgi:hypothetical protein